MMGREPVPSVASGAACWRSLAREVDFGVGGNTTASHMMRLGLDRPAMGAASTVTACVQAKARSRPDALAFRFLSDRGEATALTFGGLAEAMERVAATLASKVDPGDRVLLMMPPGLGFISTFLGILRAGAVAVPLAPPRGRRHLDRIRAVVGAARPAVAWGAPKVGEVLPDGLARIDTVAPDGRAPDPVEADAVALVQFTSGSTRNPRGVVLTHRNLLDNLAQMASGFELGDDFVCVGWLPLQHDMGLIGNVLAPLYMGRPCTLMSPESFLMKPSRWLRAISDEGATVSGGPDFAYALCADRVRDEELEGVDLTSWRVAFSGAEPVRAQTLDRFTSRFSQFGFRRASFFPCYGLAEATLLVTSGPVSEVPVVRAFDRGALESGTLVPVSAESEAGRDLVGVGRAHLGQVLRIVDEDGRACPDNRVGEIWVRGGSVGQGYFGNREETEASFGGELEGQGGWLRTGDLGGLFGGELYVTGRAKDLIILGGRNIYPQDVEQVVAQAHEDLADNGCIAFSDDDGEQERVVLVCEVARTAVRRIDADGVRAAVRKACFQGEGLNPNEIVFVRPGGLPRTTSGKPRRRSCRELFLRGDLEVIQEKVG